MNAEWLLIQPDSGKGNGIISFSAGPNNGLDRSVAVAVTDGNGNIRNLRVSQSGILTIQADMGHPLQKTYTTFRNDELYDNFRSIKRFDIIFSSFQNSTDDRIVLAVDHFSEDGTICFSAIIPPETLNLKINIRILAVRMISDGIKYIQLTPQAAF